MTGDDDVAEAVKALTAAAFTERGECQLCSHSCTGRALIHCRVGGIGADWDLADVIDFVENADQIMWVPDVVGHQLAAVDGDRKLFFEVWAPEWVQDKWKSS